MTKNHEYKAQIRWTGNRGDGNRRYRGYDRKWVIETAGKPVVHCSNDPQLGGHPALHNPEDLLISALSACHMLWYLHLACNLGVIVNDYCDMPIGIGESKSDGSGQFVKAILCPQITLAAGTSVPLADQIHGDIHAHCFIARSVNFPIEVKADYKVLNG